MLSDALPRSLIGGFKMNEYSKNVKQQYAEPTVEIITLNINDVVITSGGGPGIPLPDQPVDIESDFIID